MAKQRKKKSNKTLYIAIISLVLVIAILLGAKSAGLIGKTRELDVVLSKSTHTTIVEKVSASGAVQPVVEVKLSPDVAGEIIELKVEEGDSIVKGQILVEIRKDNYLTAVQRAEASLNQQKANRESAKANLERSKATYTRAQADFKRSEKLWEEKVLSQSEWDLAVQNNKIAANDLSSAKSAKLAADYIVISTTAALSDAYENLRKTTISSPISGTVSQLSVEQGERVVGTSQMTGTEMMRLANLNEMEVQVDVNENDIIRISIGDTAIIDVDSYTYMDKEFEGVVTHIANTANPKASADAVTEFKVKIKILESAFTELRGEGIKAPFRPGMTASVDIITMTKDNVLTVPLASVTTRSREDVDKALRGDVSEDEVVETDDEEEEEDVTVEKEDQVEVVFINDNGIAKLVEVETGISDYDNIEILSGIELDQEIVSGPFLVVSKRIKHGEAIKNKDEKKDDRDSEEEETEE